MREKIKKTAVNKEIFTKILHLKGKSIREVGDLDRYKICTEKTIRRSLNRGIMKSVYLEEISKLVDVDPRFMSGDLFRAKKRFFIGNEAKYVDTYLSHIDEYPYSRQNDDKLSEQDINTYLRNLFSIFYISMKQYDELTLEQQLDLQFDILNANAEILRRYFKKDRFGDKDMSRAAKLFLDFENYAEEMGCKNPRRFAETAFYTTVKSNKKSASINAKERIYSP